MTAPPVTPVVVRVEVARLALSVTVVRPDTAPPTPPAVLPVVTGTSIVTPLLMTTSFVAVAGHEVVSQLRPFWQHPSM